MIDAKLPTSLDGPRTLRSRAERDRRKTLLREPHIAPLTEFADMLRSADVAVPYFDPLDGGNAARMLFLFEKPGPMTDPEGGSGFISRNNDDATAEAAFHFMRQAGIDRKDTILWNVIPGWNKTIRIAKGELEQGRLALNALFTLLPRLRIVVLVGRKAAQVQANIEQRGLKVFVSHHPSPKVRAIYRDKWESIPGVWAVARQALEHTTPK